MKKNPNRMLIETQKMTSRIGLVCCPLICGGSWLIWHFAHGRMPIALPIAFSALTIFAFIFCLCWLIRNKKNEENERAEEKRIKALERKVAYYENRNRRR